jgi:cbb3-type cytochrome oxidase maturation protein
MTIIFFILPITLLLSLAAVMAFAWATRGGQFDDLRTPAIRALHEPIGSADRRHEDGTSRDL